MTVDKEATYIGKKMLYTAADKKATYTGKEMPCMAAEKEATYAVKEQLDWEWDALYDSRQRSHLH